MLLERYDRDFLATHLCAADDWRPFPPAADRDAWTALLDEPLQRQRCAWVLGRAEGLAGQPWPALPATLYMQYVRNGDRSRYEAPYFERRHRLSWLVLAECFEYRGRFLDEIANGLLAICEEFDWTLPAHSFKEDGDPLAATDPTVALFSAETAYLLAEILYLLDEELYELSPSLVARICDAIDERVLCPTLERDDWWWLAGGNNWTPWICHSVLAAAFYLWPEGDDLMDLTVKLTAAVDRFIANYPEDGGCDEGCSYWQQAGGAMFRYLELLHQRSGGKVDVYDEPLLRAMGMFLDTMHVDGPWFLNFSDCAARLSPERGQLYRYGDRVDAPEMRNLAMLAMRDWDAEGDVWPPFSGPGSAGTLGIALRELFWMPADAVPEPPEHPIFAWLPDSRVLVARESGDPDDGLVLAAKASHNGESHNHNDVGQFIIYLNGLPAIIDVGAPRYRRETFSAGRYDIWCIRGAGHNVPVVGEVEQAPGADYGADDVHCEDDGEVVTFTANLEGAYPAAAGLESLRRTITLDREAGVVVVRDEFLMGHIDDLRLHLYTPAPVEELEDGGFALELGEDHLLVECVSPGVDFVAETVHLDDDRLVPVWGPTLTRLTLSAEPTSSHFLWELTFEVEDDDEEE